MVTYDWMLTDIRHLIKTDIDANIWQIYLPHQFQTAARSFCHFYSSVFCSLTQLLALIQPQQKLQYLTFLETSAQIAGCHHDKISCDRLAGSTAGLKTLRLV